MAEHGEEILGNAASVFEPDWPPESEEETEWEFEEDAEGEGDVADQFNLAGDLQAVPGEHEAKGQSPFPGERLTWTYAMLAPTVLLTSTVERARGARPGFGGTVRVQFQCCSTRLRGARGQRRLNG